MDGVPVLGKRSARLVDSATFGRLCRARERIRNGHAEPVSLETMAEAAGLSRFHFLRLFGHVFGETPHAYLTRVRIERTKELLRSGIPVTEACFAVGFSSLGSFSALFAREVGRSPRAFQREAWRLVQVAERRPLLVIPYCFIARMAAPLVAEQ